MQSNMASVVRKLALLGLIDIQVKSLNFLPGETQDQFQARAAAYLKEYADLASQMMDDGGIVHFEDAEIKSQNIAANAAGATNIFTQNEEQVFSGLKSMPSVQGRSYSTTETYAGVAYDIMIRNSIRYQRAAKMMIEYGYYLMAQLWGEKVDLITVAFKSNKSLHRKDDAIAEQSEIMNELMKWAAGVTNQVDTAHALGYSDPETPYEDVPDSPLFGKGSSMGSSSGGSGTGSNPEENTGTSGGSGSGKSKAGSGREAEATEGTTPEEAGSDSGQDV
jgi:hypothetical protein